MKYIGDVIVESLRDRSIVEELPIVSTRVEKVTADHKTPWLEQWTLHTVEIEERDAENIARKLSHALDPGYWYADFKNDLTHYVIFPEMVFIVDRASPEEYKPVVTHGVAMGIPRYQLDFSPEIAYWERPED